MYKHVGCFLSTILHSKNLLCDELTRLVIVQETATLALYIHSNICTVYIILYMQVHISIFNVLCKSDSVNHVFHMYITKRVYYTDYT